MAKVVESHGAFRKYQRYPWDEWLDGQQRELKMGKDFFVAPITVQRQALKTCKRLGIRVRTRVVGEYLYVQALLDATDIKGRTKANTNGDRA